MKTIQNYNVFLVFFPICILISLGYLIPRSAFILSTTLYILLFIWYYVICQIKMTWGQIIGLSVILRLIFIGAIPFLSDDIWRYLWDGHIWLKGINAYSTIPNEVTDLGSSMEFMRESMNSPHLYSIYPPLTQAFFALVAWISGDSILSAIIWFHFLVLVIELLTLFLIRAVWSSKGVDIVKWYTFNPLILLELSGNLHTEFLFLLSIMLFLFAIKKSSSVGRIMALSMAILVKIIPFIFLPVLLSDQHTFKRSMLEGLFILVLVVLGAYVTGVFTYAASFSEAFLYYFKKFEFNALTLLIRDALIGASYWSLWDYSLMIKGYFPAELLLKWDPHLVFSLICKTTELILFTYLTYTFVIKKQMTVQYYLYVMYLVYILFTDTLHPWYLCPLILLGIPLNMKTPIIWSFVIFLSYSTYMSTPYEPSYLMQIIEYTVVILALIHDHSSKRFRFFLLHD